MGQQQFGSITKTVSATGTPEALGSGAVRAHSITFVGMNPADSELSIAEGGTDTAGLLWNVLTHSGYNTPHDDSRGSINMSLMAETKSEITSAEKLSSGFNAFGAGLY